MSHKRLIQLVMVIVIVSSVLILAVGIAMAQGPGGRGQGRGGQGNRAPRGTGDQAGICQEEGFVNIPPMTDLELSDEVVEALEAGLMDEYHAQAVYQAVMDNFGTVRPFVNIERAEANHIAALTFIFERYELEIPEPPELDPVPEFETVIEACQVAADAEIANFTLYDEWMEAAEDYPDIAYVFTTLRDASEFNHLPAFERCAN